jgi:hypothetical protein
LLLLLSLFLGDAPRLKECQTEGALVPGTSFQSHLCCENKKNLKLLAACRTFGIPSSTLIVLTLQAVKGMAF